MKGKLRFDSILVILVALLGVSFSIYQFLYNRSLWLDESYLALNIIKRSFLELLKPLDYEQVAPILFLYVEKFITSIFGISEYAFRIFPLLCFWASIYFMYKIFRILQTNMYVIALSLSLFVFNGALIYYSSEIKQYMTDVLVITAMFYFTVKDYESIEKKYLVLGILGSVSIFLSNVSPIILFCCGSYLLYNDWFNGKREIKHLFKISFFWLLFFGLYFFFFIYDHPTRDFMVMYWSFWEGGAFMPLNPFRIEFYQFIIRKYYFFYTDLFRFGIVGFYGLQLLFLLGCYTIVEQKKTNLFLIGLLPVTLHLALSSMKLYPFDTRLILYTCPAFIIILSKGIEYVFQSLKEYNPVLTKASVSVMLFFFFYSAYLLTPQKADEPRESIFYVNQNIKEGDVVFASHYSKFPLMYYTQSSKVDFSEHKVIMEEYEPLDDFEESLDELTGRVWFIFRDGLEYKRLEILRKKFGDAHYRLLDQYNTKLVTVLLYQIDK